MATAPTLEAALEEALTEGAIVTVDMAGVRFMGSDGIRVLVWARKRLRSVDGDLFLRAVAPGIQRALAICGLEDLIGDDRGQPRVEFVGDALTRRTPGDGSADLLA
jgi:anti-anti-sigma factor